MDLNGFLHLLLYVFISFYAFLFQKNWFDVWYILFNFIIAISWTIFKGECIFSLLIKWKNDPSYKMGTDTTAHDIREFLGKEYVTFMKYVCYLLLFMRAYSIYIVMTRLNIKHSTLLSYFFLLYTLTNKYISFLLYQLFFFFVFLYTIIVTI
jgi:hypothetical protein